MNDNLYREFERVCALFFEDLDRFVQASEAEVKPMLFDDLRRLTPLAQDEYGKRDPVFLKQLRNRLPPVDGERQKFCVHGIIGARQTGASNEHEHQTQFS